MGSIVGAQWDTKLESYQAALFLAEAIAALEDEETKKKVEGILTKAKEAVWNAQTKTSKLQSQNEQNCCCMWGHVCSAYLEVTKQTYSNGNTKLPLMTATNKTTINYVYSDRIEFLFPWLMQEDSTLLEFQSAFWGMLE